MNDSFDAKTGSSASTSDVAKDASTSDVAKDQASQVSDTAKDAGQNVADTAKDQASQVAGETKHQAKKLVGSATGEVQAQVGAQQQKLAGLVSSMADELHGMASNSSESGPVTDLVRQASSKGSEIASFLEDREPRDLLEEAKSFARRRPGTFLAICGIAGVVAGRVTRGAVAANTSVDSPDKSDKYSSGRRALTDTGYQTPSYQPVAVEPAYATAPAESAYASGGDPAVAPMSMVEEPPASGEVDSYGADVRSAGFGDQPSGRSDSMP